MSTPGAQAGLETFDALHIEYENAYKDNAFKKACIEKAISMLPPDSRVLDVGCGTGVPVSEMLSKAGMQVTGTDISPKMVKLAQDRVKGDFKVADMLTFEPEGSFAGVFIIFAYLQLSYADFHSAAYKFASALKPGGIFAIGGMPADIYVKESDYDETQTWVENFPAPFWGELLPTFMMRADGLLEFLRSMGLEILSSEIDAFQPNNERCAPEEQQYVIARRKDGQPLPKPKPLPQKR
ncbi:hypothetical protein LTR36_003305 [Oleoguttula mirabilis]|uniref:Methyltransferase domain-containing protein n=1 Tax=Oleoguttula mirabilis TaxID=1507867 RepID=A0AAV9K0C7_9PEZI|nr:hypothetical protein LTR36_003305 [Oleoguttula mirabilis]